VSLRRIRYQMRCAAKGHDVRPHLVGGSLVEHRCLRCGALIGKPVPATAAARRPADVEQAPPPLPDDEPASAHEPRAGADANGDAPSPDDAATPTASALAALRELGDLHAAGVLTDEEFAAKKAELLAEI